jgi:hypothetical protein
LEGWHISHYTTPANLNDCIIPDTGCTKKVQPASLLV